MYGAFKVGSTIPLMPVPAAPPSCCCCCPFSSPAKDEDDREVFPYREINSHDTYEGAQSTNHPPSLQLSIDNLEKHLVDIWKINVVAAQRRAQQDGTEPPVIPRDTECAERLREAIVCFKRGYLQIWGDATRRIFFNKAGLLVLDIDWTLIHRQNGTYFCAKHGLPQAAIQKVIKAALDQDMTILLLTAGLHLPDYFIHNVMMGIFGLTLQEIKQHVDLVAAARYKGKALQAWIQANDFVVRDLNSIVFVDDNMIHYREVSEALPYVQCYHVPAKEREQLQKLPGIWKNVLEAVERVAPSSVAGAAKVVAAGAA